MRIEAVKVKVNDGYVFKVTKMDYCCEKIKANPTIGLHAEPSYDVYCQVCDHEADNCCKECTLNETDDVGIMRLAMMIEEEYTYPEPWEDSYTTDYRYYPISYCPHCGRKIEIRIVGEEDMNEAYNTLVQKAAEIQKEIRSTDSKRKSEKLEKERREIWRKINNMCEAIIYEQV